VKRSLLASTIVLALCAVAPLARAQDAAVDDATVEDAGVEDAGVEDAGVEDAVVADSSLPDTAQPDVPQSDAARPDISQPDISLPDAAQPDAGSSCGTVSYIGECVGDSVRYCSGDSVATIDCTTQYGAFATCGLLDCTDVNAGCLGYFCVLRDGEACGGDGDLTCDVEADQGCINSACASSTACDPATYSSQCNGHALTTCGYTINERDCSGGGATPRTCGVTSNGSSACVGLEGDTCGGTIGRECTLGLRCSSGVCVGAGADGGSTADAGDDGDGGGGCLCRGASSTLSLPLLLAALYAAVRRRRR